MSFYDQRGVSAQKEEVHRATEKLDKGLFPGAFTKVYPDYLAGNTDFVNVMHADGAGTKSILAYLYWKETGDLSVWRNIAQDAIVMNLDDLLCVGIYDNIIFNSTIDRNKKLIPGEVLSEIINGTNDFFHSLKAFGIHIHFLGGETADVGDVVRTIAVNGTMAARWPHAKIISNEKITAGDVIVGLAGYGMTNYETEYNSGIGSNGLTSARHDVLSEFYAKHFPESFEPTLQKEVVYIGKHRLTDPFHIQHETQSLQTTVGKLLLSPTRTFAPFIADLLRSSFAEIHGLIHCSGGGQTKCLKYLPENLRVIKSGLPEMPPVFTLIQENSNTSLREMYEVFNMGCRMEIYCSESFASSLINTAAKFGIEAWIIGRVEEAPKKELRLIIAGEELIY